MSYVIIGIVIDICFLSAVNSHRFEKGYGVGSWKFRFGITLGLTTAVHG